MPRSGLSDTHALHKGPVSEVDSKSNITTPIPSHLTCVHIFSFSGLSSFGGLFPFRRLLRGFSRSTLNSSLLFSFKSLFCTFLDSAGGGSEGFDRGSEGAWFGVAPALAALAGLDDCKGSMVKITDNNRAQRSLGQVSGKLYGFTKMWQKSKT
jgi:hypothetical protein